MSTRVISKTIDLSAEKVSKYITAINQDGIKVHAENNPNLNYTKINAEGMEVHQNVNNTDKTVASFGINGSQIGTNNQSHLFMDFHSTQAIDKEGNTYFYVSDLRDADGNMSFTFIGDGETNIFDVPDPTYNVNKVTVDGVEDDDWIAILDTATGYTQVGLTNIPADGAVIVITWTPPNADTKAYTFGTRLENSNLGSFSVVEGKNNIASGRCSHAEGYLSNATADYSHAEGWKTEASGYASHAEGYNTTANDYGSHAEGYLTTASDRGSHAEGYRTTVTKSAAHAEGYYTTASGHYAHAEGYYTTASGLTSHAEGERTTAKKLTSHAQNMNTIASMRAQTALGSYNVEDTATTTTHPSGMVDYGEYAVILGNGTADDARSNALTVDWNGIIGAQNTLAYGTCSTAAGTATKTVTVNAPFKTLSVGATVAVKFTYTNSASYPTLNVNSTGAKAIMRYGTTNPGTIAETSWNAGSVVCFIYDGTFWMMMDWQSDYKVAQNHSTSDTNYNIGLANYSSATTGTSSINHSTKIKGNPSTGRITTSDLSSSAVSVFIDALKVNGTSVAPSSSEVVTSTDLKNVLNGLLSVFYPVGSYYETSDTTFNPNTAWGGTWELETAGQVHVSSGTGYTVSGATTNTTDGGASTVTLTTAMIPGHTHGNKSLTGSVRLFKGNQSTTASGILSFASATNRQYSSDGTSTNSWQTMTVNASHEHTSVGGGGAHENMPPYIVVNRWHRTA